MVTIKTISDKTVSVTTTTRTVVLEVKGFKVTEIYVNGKLSSQRWKSNGHKDVYEPSTLYFEYYDDISFLSSDDVIDYITFYDKIPEPSLVRDWKKFKGLDHVLCVRLGMDGNIYRIDKETPIAMWRHHDYIGGICNDKYDLEKAAKVLRKKSWIRSVEIKEIPYYNQEEGHTHAVEFDYKLPSKKDLVILRKEKMFSDLYIGL